MNPNQNLQIPLFHTTYQYHWILIRKRGPYWYDTSKFQTLLCARCVLIALLEDERDELLDMLS